MKAIVVNETGGPEVMMLSDVDRPTIAAGGVLVRVDAAGVNFIDIYHRTGVYSQPLPFTPGLEGAGEVVAAGDASRFSAGDRVAWTGSLGSYAELIAIDDDQAVAIPDGVDGATAAAAMLQGMTAHYLVNDTYPLSSGERCLIHAGAGGVGLLLIQMAKATGAEVFTTVSTAEKAELAGRAGADHVIRYADGDFGDEVERIAGPRALAVVYDGVGRATFDRGLELLAPRGVMVLFGQASGVVPPFDLGRLATNGSLYVTRPTLFTHIAGREALERRAGAVLGAIQRGDLEVRIGQTWPLPQAADAHEALQGRETTGKVLLIP